MHLLGMASFTGGVGVALIGISYATGGTGQVAFLVVGIILVLTGLRFAVMAHCEHRGWPYPWDRLSIVQRLKSDWTSRKFVRNARRNGIVPERRGGNWICPYCDEPNKAEYDWCRQCNARLGGYAGIGNTVMPPEGWPAGEV